MCFSEVYGVHDKTFTKCLCFLGLIYSLVLAVHATYAYQSQAFSDQWQLYVDHFKPQEINYYITISICNAIGCLATVANTYVTNRKVIYTTGSVVSLVTIVSLISFTTCITAGPCHMVKKYMLLSYMWPFVVMFCLFLNILYLEEILSNNYFDWQYLTDKFTISIPRILHPV
ncbi:hypothetical protein M8J76_016499 [Diaphorina citri]|nr:hypothetical protein M8J75_005281 [Diaphorina citri]KAI5746027.1 hypothetical protein M8J76_016499 [Diaphorina citri]